MNTLCKQLRLLALTGSLLFCMTGMAHATTDSQPITIGYLPNYGTIQIPTVNGSEGYGYEYFTELLRKADGDFTVHFTSCSTLDDGLAMLDSGEIDVFGPVVSTDLEGVTYSQHDFGKCQMLLAALASDDVYYGDYSALDGTTIGIPEYYAEETDLVEAFLDEKGLSAQLLTVPSNGIAACLQSGLIDFVLISSLQTQTGLQAAARIGTAYVYYITSEKQRSLMAEIDIAMDHLEDQSYLYQTQLYAKYIGYGAIAKSYISPEEYDISAGQTGVYCGNARFSLSSML